MKKAKAKEKVKANVKENAKANVDSPQKLHSSLALFAVDDTQVDYICERMSGDDSMIRDVLLPHKEAFVDKLWSVVEQPAKGKESQRLWAACALASYDPANSRWEKSIGWVVEQLVTKNLWRMPQLTEKFWPVRIKMLPALAGIFKDRKDERTSERNQATRILADYAADQPRVLADLVLDADENQFDEPACKGLAAAQA